MNFKSSKYRADNTKAPWEGKEKIYFVNNNELEKRITIDETGIYS